MSVYSPLLLPPPQLRGRELREILPPHDPRAFARFSQWLFKARCAVMMIRPYKPRDSARSALLDCST
jgi:hypothetical protein